MYSFRKSGCIILTVLFVFCCTLINGAENSIAALTITFNAPIVDGTIRSAELFKHIESIIHSRETRIASDAENAGAIWALSSNLSGGQLSFFHADSPEIVVNLAEKAIAEITHLDLARLTSDKKPDVFHLLPGICPDFQYDNIRGATIFSRGINQEFLNKIASDVTLLSQKFPRFNYLGNNFHPTQKGIPPTLFKVFTWPDNNNASFFSAKYAAEILSRQIKKYDGAGYEIIHTTDGLKLIIAISGTEDRLYKAEKTIGEISELINSSNSTPEWQMFARAASAIAEDDRRDVAKGIMLSAWNNHWQTRTDYSTTVQSYLPPISNCNFLSLPEPWMHNFSFSRNLFPRFATARAVDNREQADVTISFSSPNHKLIADIKQIFSGLVSLEFTLSLESVSEDHLIAGFHCQITDVTTYISVIRAKILDWLVKNGLTEELKNSIFIDIAAVADTAPHHLRGLIQEGWPPSEFIHDWQTADSNDLPVIMNIKHENPDSLKNRWKLLCSSGKGKSRALASAAKNGLRLKNFSLP